MKEQVTPLILTRNEEVNIGRVLEKLCWAKEVIIIDSGSTDRTKEIASSFSQVRIVEREFDCHTDQWNFGLEQVQSEWVLTMDADYILSDQLLSEIDGLNPEDGVSGYYLPFRYCIHGTPLKHSHILPPRAALFRLNKGRYIPDGHTQLAEIDGTVQELSGHIFHDDRKPFSRWFNSQKNYAKLEAEKLLGTPYNSLSMQDKLRLLVLPAPIVVLFYCLFYRLGILDGWRGCYYALQRSIAEAVIAVALVKRRLNVPK